MEACLTGCEFAQEFFVFTGEVFMELNECLLSHRADAPSVTCSGEDASCLEHYEYEVLDGVIC